MAFKVANTVVINDAGSITGLADGFNVNCQLCFTDTRCSPVQGELSGYVSGGDAPPVCYDTIEKFPFASDTSSTDVGEMTGNFATMSGQSSSVSGYNTGGNDGATFSCIQKFPFAADGASSVVGALAFNCRLMCSAGHSSETSGYTAGGSLPTAPSGMDIIQKFPFSSDTDATDIAELSVCRTGVTGQSSKDFGYTTGGVAPTPPRCDTIDKFPFSSDAPATDVGELTTQVQDAAGQSSCVSGYSSGGYGSSPGGPGIACHVIHKWPFSTDASATDVGELFCCRRRVSGTSSITNGYSSGGEVTFVGKKSEIDKFPFSSDTPATDVGELTVAKEDTAGQQV